MHLLLVVYGLLFADDSIFCESMADPIFKKKIKIISGKDSILSVAK